MAAILRRHAIALSDDQTVLAEVDTGARRLRRDLPANAHRYPATRFCGKRSDAQCLGHCQIKLRCQNFIALQKRMCEQKSAYTSSLMLPSPGNGALGAAVAVILAAVVGRHVAAQVCAVLLVFFKLDGAELMELRHQISPTVGDE